MAQIKIPHADNPFGIGVDVQSTHEMGMSAVPDTQYGGVRMAKELEAAAKAWQMDVEDTLAQDLMNELEQARLQQQDDPETGWRNQLGKNALERESGKSLTEEAQENLKQSYETIRKRAGTQRIRRKLDDFYKGADASLTNNVNAHVNKQFLSYQADTDQATLNNALTQGLSENPEEAASGLAVSRAMVEKMYGRAGLDPDYSKGPGVIHTARLGKMYDEGNVAEADAYFEANRHEMSVEQVAQVQRVQKAARTEADIESQAQKIITTHGDTKEGMIKALREANALAGTKEGKHVNARVKQHYALLEEEWKLRGAEAAQVAMKELEEKGKVPPSVMEDLKEYAPESYERIRAYMLKGQAIKTDQATYRRLSVMRDADPVGFAGVNLLEYRGLLTERDIAELEMDQKKLGDVQYKQFSKELENIIKRTSRLRSNEEKAANFRAGAKRFFLYQMESRKEPFKPEEIARMAQGLAKGEDTSGWFKSDYSYAENMVAPIPGFSHSVDIDAAATKIQADFGAIAGAVGFNADVLKNSDPKVKELAYIYFRTGQFPRDVTKLAREAVEKDRRLAGDNEPITQFRVYQKVIELYFKNPNLNKDK